jgi:hypothetical protein
MQQEPAPDRSEIRAALAVLMQIPVEAMTEARLDELLRKIVIDAENDAARVGDHREHLAEHRRLIGCVTANQITDYLEFANQVLADLYREASKSSPSPSKLKRLLLQYVLDARQPIQGSVYRFDLTRQESGYKLVEYRAAEMRVRAIPMPGRNVKDVFAVSLLEALQGDPPQIYRLREIVEQMLDCEQLESTVRSVESNVDAGGAVVADLVASTLSFGGVTYQLDLPSILFVKAVAEANGEWVTSPAMIAQSELIGQRPDRLVRRLPAAVQRHIEGRRGRGYRLRME